MQRFRRMSTGFAAGMAVLLMIHFNRGAIVEITLACCVAAVFYNLIDAIQEPGTANASPAEDGTHAGGTKN